MGEAGGRWFIFDGNGVRGPVVDTLAFRPVPAEGLLPGAHPHPPDQVPCATGVWFRCGRGGQAQIHRHGQHIGQSLISKTLGEHVGETYYERFCRAKDLRLRASFHESATPISPRVWLIAMEDSWATFGADLHLTLEGPRLRASLEQALREAVRTGRLTAGTRLPSSRSLAGDLGIARNTVANVYGQLVAEGWLTARHGSGTRVSDRMAPEPTTTEVLSPLLSVGPPNIAYNLRPGSPDLSAFPTGAWLSAARRALMTAPYEALGYCEPQGRPELRRSIAQYLARARGVYATPDRIVVCSGTVQAVMLLSRALQVMGATKVALESPGFHVLRNVIIAGGLSIQSVGVDDHGAKIDELVAGDADAALLTPAHQFPMGAFLAPQRRAAAIEWARVTGGLLIEDDYDGEFRYDRQPTGALQGLDPEHVVYIGTASKSLAPGLRLGWMVLPQRLVEPVALAKSVTDWQTTTFEQLVLAEFIESGAYDRHIRRSRLRYHKRRDRLVTVLATRAPHVRVTGISAGLHAVLELPRPLRAMHEDAAMTWAESRGLALDRLSLYRYPTQEDVPAGLVIGYGTPPDHAFAGALDVLCDVLNEPAELFMEVCNSSSARSGPRSS